MVRSISWKASICVYTEMWCSPTSALGIRMHLIIKSNIEYFCYNQWLWEFSLLETIFSSSGCLACVASTKQVGEKKKSIVKAWEFGFEPGLVSLWPWRAFLVCGVCSMCME